MANEKMETASEMMDDLMDEVRPSYCARIYLPAKIHKISCWKLKKNFLCFATLWSFLNYCVTRVKREYNTFLPHTHPYIRTYTSTCITAHPLTLQFDGDMEDEVDEITSGVLAELNIEVRNALPAAPSGPTRGKAAVRQPVRQTTGDKATDALLAELGI